MKHLSSQRLSPDTQPFTLNHIQQLCLTQRTRKNFISRFSFTSSKINFLPPHFILSDNIVLLGNTLGLHKNVVPRRLLLNLWCQQQTFLRMWEQLKARSKELLEFVCTWRIFFWTWKSGRTTLSCYVPRWQRFCLSKGWENHDGKSQQYNP